MTQADPDASRVFSATLARLPRDCRIEPKSDELKRFPDTLDRLSESCSLPPYLPDLARLELALSSLEEGPQVSCSRPAVNPTLKHLELGWSGLAGFLNPSPDHKAAPSRVPETLLLYQDPTSRGPRARPARPEHLLALKIVSEGLDPIQVAREQGRSASWLTSLLDRARELGLVLWPESGIRREPEILAPSGEWARRYDQARVFTLQWHITQACDLHCRHCYDRNPRSRTSLEDGLTVLEDLYRFCEQRSVRGQVSFTGGNPLLHPDFESLFARAGDLGFRLAILGNPAPKKRIQALIARHPLSFFQVSLEGLAAHNDWIRGPGHFERTLEFLGLLKELSIPSQVMLTLTRDNMDQILPLADELKGLTDCLTFNRLSQTGEGSRLALPEPDSFAAFLRDYVQAADTNPVLGFKENLLNIVLKQERNRIFGGCTGFGCGAAFNFVSLLSDGEVHACRKFPSLIGHLPEQGLEDIYESDQARSYRSGPEGCRTCSLRPVCGGCQAVISSSGLDVGQDRDPFCFA
jgi:selenobiotic family peptide radical SAM maturase